MIHTTFLLFAEGLLTPAEYQRMIVLDQAKRELEFRTEMIWWEIYQEWWDLVPPLPDR